VAARLRGGEPGCGAVLAGRTAAVGSSRAAERRPFPGRPDVPADTWLMLDSGDLAERRRAVRRPACAGQADAPTVLDHTPPRRVRWSEPRRGSGVVPRLCELDHKRAHFAAYGVPPAGRTDVFTARPPTAESFVTHQMFVEVMRGARDPTSRRRAEPSGRAALRRRTRDELGRDDGGRVDCKEPQIPDHAGGRSAGWSHHEPAAPWRPSGPPAAAP
jgi:hypothetical protein